jgi:hypothetical protein
MDQTERKGNLENVPAIEEEQINVLDFDLLVFVGGGDEGSGLINIPR